MDDFNRTCANCHRGILKPNGRVACGAGFEEGPIWAEGYENQIAPLLARALGGFGGVGRASDFPRADDMKGSQGNCKIFEMNR